jgi:hypothetical protein
MRQSNPALTNTVVTADWYGTGQIVSGTHNYGGDPRFAADGYRLMVGSAAIDRGIDAGATTDEV